VLAAIIERDAFLVYQVIADDSLADLGDADDRVVHTHHVSFDERRQLEQDIYPKDILARLPVTREDARVDLERPPQFLMQPPANGLHMLLGGELEIHAIAYDVLFRAVDAAWGVPGDLGADRLEHVGAYLLAIRAAHLQDALEVIRAELAAFRAEREADTRLDAIETMLRRLDLDLDLLRDARPFLEIIKDRRHAHVMIKLEAPAELRADRRGKILARSPFVLLERRAAARAEGHREILPVFRQRVDDERACAAVLSSDVLLSAAGTESHTGNGRGGI